MADTCGTCHHYRDAQAIETWCSRTNAGADGNDKACEKYKPKEARMEAWQERVVEEKNELIKRINKLSEFISRNDVSGVDDIALLREQRKAMCDYNKILDKRIMSFKPVKTVAPWSFETAPRGGWIRFKFENEKVTWVHMIRDISTHGVNLYTRVMPYHELMKECEYSPNGVDQWGVCGVVQ
jgi:hypothetical protein